MKRFLILMFCFSLFLPSNAFGIANDAVVTWISKSSCNTIISDVHPGPKIHWILRAGGRVVASGTGTIPRQLASAYGVHATMDLAVAAAEGRLIQTSIGNAVASSTTVCKNVGLTGRLLSGYGLVVITNGVGEVVSLCSGVEGLGWQDQCVFEAEQTPEDIWDYGWIVGSNLLTPDPIQGPYTMGTSTYAL